MDGRAFRDFLFSATVAFALWVAAYLGLVSVFSHRNVWNKLVTMPLEIALFWVLVLIFCWFITCCALAAVRALVVRMELPSRVLAETVFVLAVGFCGGLMLSWMAWTLAALLPAWCFFSFPALVMVLAQRGLEWYRRRKQGRG